MTVTWDTFADGDAGVYRLLIEVVRPVCLQVGALRECAFPAGRYVYCGSAQRNLQARITRHCRKRKNRYWHIDYLLAHPAARVIAVETFPGGKHDECDLVARARRAGGRVLIPGFGAGDCPTKRTCGAHLIWMGEGPATTA